MGPRHHDLGQAGRPESRLGNNRSSVKTSVVGRTGLEPVTPCASCKCATNCANGPTVYFSCSEAIFPLSSKLQFPLVSNAARFELRRINHPSRRPTSEGAESHRKRI